MSPGVCWWLSCLDSQEILDHEDGKNLLNESDLYKNSPLHVAAMNGFALVVEVGFGRIFPFFGQCRIKLSLRHNW